MTPTTSRVLIGCGITGLAVVIALVAGGAWFYNAVTVRHIEASISAPLSVALDEPFDITVHIKNTASVSQSLVDLDVAQGYLSGVAIRSASPPYKESTGLPLNGGTSLTFKHSIPANGELVVVLHAVGVQEGDFSGDIDLCINSSFGFVTHQVRTMVTKNGA